MKILSVLPWLAALMLSLGGCASIPNVTAGYYLATSNVGLTVIRTVACDKDGQTIVGTTVTPLVTHSADRRGGRLEFKYADFSSPLADSDVKLDFFDDGRLKGVNASNTGEGESILKAGLAIIPLLSKLKYEQPDHGGLSKDGCAEIRRWGHSKPLSLVYRIGSLDLNLINKKQPLEPDFASKLYAYRLEGTIGRVCAFITKVKQIDSPLTHVAGLSEVVLKARQPAVLGMEVAVGKTDACRDDVVWTGGALVAQLGTQYEIPIKKPPVFGKQGFAVTFGESGLLTSISYSSGSGLAQALNVGSAALTTVHGETNAQKAADLKAEADIIAQQQRLIACQADPPSCEP